MKKIILPFSALIILLFACKNDTSSPLTSVFKKQITAEEFAGEYDIQLDKEVINEINSKTGESKFGKAILSFGLSQLDLDLSANEESLHVNGNLNFLKDLTPNGFGTGDSKEGKAYRIEDNMLLIENGSSVDTAYLHREPYGFKLEIENKKSDNLNVDSFVLLLKRKEKSGE